LERDNAIDKLEDWLSDFITIAVLPWKKNHSCWKNWVLWNRHDFRVLEFKMKEKIMEKIKKDHSRDPPQENSQSWQFIYT